MRLGLTGGIGCGVSEAARRFEELGARVIYADDVGHEVLLMPEVNRELIEALGAQILNASGEIDRKRLGRMIFADEQARKSLNRIVHPLLLDRLAAYARALEAQGEDVVVDAALIYEWGAQGFFHKVVVVSAPVETRLDRVMARDNLTREQTLQRIQTQMPLEKKVERADYVLMNDGPLEELYRQVDEVWQSLRTQ
jgi:dephospho-CoA kinase